MLSYKSSSDSMSTSGEFEIVAEGAKGPVEKRTAESLPLNPAPTSTTLQSMAVATTSPGLRLATSPPTLNIANNGDMMDLEQNLKEMIREIEKSPVDSETPSSATAGKNGINSSCVHCTMSGAFCRLRDGQWVCGPLTGWVACVDLLEPILAFTSRYVER